MSQQPVPETRLAPWSGQLRGLLFGLAPDGVFRALAITRQAVGSYPAFSPLPLTHRLQRRYFFCGTFRQRGLATAPPACIPPAQAWVTRHRALRSSDFPPRAEAQSDSPPFQDRRLFCQFFCRFQVPGSRNAPPNHRSGSNGPANAAGGASSCEPFSRLKVVPAALMFGK